MNALVTDKCLCQSCYSLCEGSIGMIPEFPVASPVGHVSADGMATLLPQNLFYEVCTGHINNNQWSIFGLPKWAVDFAVLYLH